MYAEYIAAVYSTLREDEVQQEIPHSYTTARTLLSILRLSQALAKLRFADCVDRVQHCILFCLACFHHAIYITETLALVANCQHSSLIMTSIARPMP